MALQEPYMFEDIATYEFSHGNRLPVPAYVLVCFAIAPGQNGYWNRQYPILSDNPGSNNISPVLLSSVPAVFPFLLSVSARQGAFRHRLFPSGILQRLLKGQAQKNIPDGIVLCSLT